MYVQPIKVGIMHSNQEIVAKGKRSGNGGSNLWVGVHGRQQRWEEHGLLPAGEGFWAEVGERFWEEVGESFWEGSGSPEWWSRPDLSQNVNFVKRSYTENVSFRSPSGRVEGGIREDPR